MIGVGLLAGIGFTMSIFIALLSFKGELHIQDEA
ncbi:Na+/H+ antiporter NhaA, partial [Chryseobacterium sp. CH1]